MQRDEHYSIDRTPIKMIEKLGKKQLSQRLLKTNNEPARSNRNDLAGSPYNVKNARPYSTTVHPRHIQSKQNQMEAVPGRKIEIRMKSAPHQAAKTNNASNYQQHKQQSSPNVEARMKVLKKAASQSIFRKKTLLQSQSSTTKPHLSQRKFVISVVDLEPNKDKRKAQQLIDKKLEAFSYQSIMGDFRPFQGKKLAQILVDQTGQVRLYKS